MLRISWVIWAFILVLVFSDWADAENQENNVIVIAMREWAEVNRKQVVLGDVAEFSDPAAEQHLSTLVITTAPLPGKSRSISQADVLLRLRRALKDKRRFLLSGAPVTIVHSVSQKLTKTHLEDWLFRELGRTVSLLHAPKELDLPRGRLTMKLASVPKGLPSTVALIVSVDGERQRVVTVGIGPHRSDVLVMTRAVRRGEPITLADVEAKKVEGLIPRGVLSDLSLLIGKKTNRSLEAGEMLYANIVVSIPVIRRGDALKLISHRGSVNVEGSGLALNEGGIGDIIGVRVAWSRKALDARVISAGVVQALPKLEGRRRQ